MLSQLISGIDRKIPPSANVIRSDQSVNEKIFVIFIYAFIISFAVICILPFWLVIIGSFTPENELRQQGFKLLPLGFSTDAYNYIFHGRQLILSYGVTITVTVLGTFLALLVTVPFAYVLASRKASLSRPLSLVTYFSMILGGGLVGFYIMVTNWLHLKDTIWAMILPYLLNPFYAFVLVAYFRTIPQELVDAATIDGANDLIIFWRVITPISVPIIATIGLFYALQYWNDWWLALLFVDNYKLHPLQIMIRQIYSQVNAAQYINSGSTSIQRAIPAYGVRMAAVCLTIGPIILVYPFVQRYFVKGITIGALKG